MSERSVVRPVRLPPLPPEAWDDEVDTALAAMVPAERRTPEKAGNLLATLVRNPALTRSFLRFNRHLLYGSTLPDRLRELAILAVAHRTGCTYEWEHHVHMGHEVGLTDADIDGVRTGEAAGELDRAVLAAVAELDESSTVGDATWTTLSAHLDEKQVMDLVFTIGSYGALAMAINTFGVQPDPAGE